MIQEKIRNVDFDEVLERIKKLKNLKFDYEVAEMLGITKQNLAERKTRKSLPLDKLQIFCERELLNYEWLLTGKGNMTRTPPIMSTIQESIVIPVLGRVPAGFPETVDDKDIIETISLPNIPADCYALIVHGESMGPDIRSGDYALFIPIDRADVRPGNIVIANNEFGEPMIKRYVLKDGEPYLKSDNQGYPSFKPNDHYRIVGKVIKVWREIKI